MIPTAVFAFWLLGPLSLALLASGPYLVYRWYERAQKYDSSLDRVVFDPNLGLNGETALLATGLGLLILALAGGPIIRGILALAAGRRAGGDRPTHERKGVVHRLTRPDGSVLQVETYGPESGPPIILTHGWGNNSTQWHHLKRQLADRYRLIVWDLPGLGLSSRPANNDYSLENLARDLEAVLGLANGRPSVLLGHSIGGMITLTFCRLFPHALGSRVAGLVLVHTTYTNPVRTTWGARFFSALERPVLVPLLHLTIWLWPLVWLMNWLGYLNGSTHLMTKLMGFAGTEAPGQVQFSAEFQPHGSPAVLARGMFGMLRYDATQTLSTVRVPTLVVAGDRDLVCLPEASERIRQGVAEARLVSLAPANHMGYLEQHEQFARVVDEFAVACSRVEPRPTIGQR